VWSLLAILLALDLRRAPPDVLPPHTIRRCVILTLLGALLVAAIHSFPPSVQHATALSFATDLVVLLVWGALAYAFCIVYQLKLRGRRRRAIEQ
jgi:hypothetical protein